MAGRQFLSQLGQADIILSGDPEITFFKEVYARQAPFATRVIDVSFKNKVNFGEDAFTDIPLNGDLMTAMYVRFYFPSSIGNNIYLLPYPGICMINYVELYSENQLIERIWGEYMILLNECQVPTSKQSSITGIVGSGDPNSPQPNYPLKFTVPLPFQCLRAGLPLVPNMRFRIGLNPSAFFTNPDATYIPSFQFNYLVEFAVLSEPEKNFIKKRKPTIYLGESVQRSQFEVTTQSSNIRCVTDFLHPVKELFFTIRNVSSFAPDYWFNYSNSIIDSTHTWSNTYSNINQLNSLGIYFEGVQRVNPLWATNIYLGTTQFLDYHTRVPTHPFYMYSFSQDPENPKPTGSVNFGRIKNQYFDFFLQPMPSWNQQDRIITIWARHYTFLEIDGFKTIKNLFDNNGDNGYFVYLP
jgi:Large eukaryotic DNA virus major capsid protein/Major capsid protein N-terminus